MQTLKAGQKFRVYIPDELAKDEAGKYLAVRKERSANSAELERLDQGKDWLVALENADTNGWAPIAKGSQPDVPIGYIKSVINGQRTWHGMEEALGPEESPATAPAVASHTYRTSLAAPKSLPLAERDYSRAALDPAKLLEMVEMVNAYRKEKGLEPLELDAHLTKAAMDHSRDLAKWDRISHYGSDGSNPWDRVARSGYGMVPEKPDLKKHGKETKILSRAALAAENVGTGQVDMAEILKGWQDSPGHNKNLLLPDAKHVGFALVKNPKTEFKTFWTMAIGAPIADSYKPEPPANKTDYFLDLGKQSTAPNLSPTRTATVGDDGFLATAEEPAAKKKYAGSHLTPPPA